MFFHNQPSIQREEYLALLRSMGSLSNLFSDNAVPFLHYRAMENIFCRAFLADNLSRSDCSIDARKGRVGIGLKTFLGKNGRSYEKVAEFNRDRELYAALEDYELICKVSDLRNRRISLTKAAHGVSEIVYHCVTRNLGQMGVSEEPIDLIDVEAIHGQARSGNTIYFTDHRHEYQFNLSKSTLFKKFETKPELVTVDVKILVDPYKFLTEKLTSETLSSTAVPSRPMQRIILPLYSATEGKVMPRSGLNMWNASGRNRHADEVYIPVPTWIHRVFPDFFPLKDLSFSLKLPNGVSLTAKMCQNQMVDGTDRGKGLMSDPNKDLGRWILRDVLGLKEGTLVTSELLHELGIDSVEIRKYGPLDFEADFKASGTFKAFQKRYGPA